MALDRRHSAWIIASSMITVASFISATAYTQNRLSRLDAFASTIETNAVPSIEYLSRAAQRLTRLGQLMDDLAAEQPSTAEQAATERSAREQVQGLEQDVGNYARLPPLPGERVHWAALRADVVRAAALVRASIERVAQGGRPSSAADHDAVDDALDATVRSVVATLDYDVGQAKAIARDVRHARRSALQRIVALDAVATCIALLGLLVAYRASRRHDELLRAHNVLLASRVSELDRFAGRVAHDLLSPLGTISLGLGLLAMRRDDQNQAIERSQRALQRARHLVQGLLEFARAAGHPDASADCSLDAVLPEIVGDCAHSAAEAGVAFVVDAEPALCVRCSPGVMTSIVQNLVQNAIKYMGARPVKRVTVRARRADAVRNDILAYLAKIDIHL
jgi:signal transduction histidine kinase